MSDLRRIPVVVPSGKAIVLVVDGTFLTGAQNGQMVEEIPVSAIVAFEECPEDIFPTTALGWDPTMPGSQASLPSSDQQ